MDEAASLVAALRLPEEDELLLLLLVLFDEEDDVVVVVLVVDVSAEQLDDLSWLVLCGRGDASA